MTKSVSDLLKDRIKTPITVKTENLPVRPMMILHNLVNPNIILVNQKIEVVTVEEEKPTYGSIDEHLKDRTLNAIIEKSEAIKAFVYEQFIPLYLGYEDAEEKILEELDIIFEGKANVNIEPLKRLILKGQTIKSVEFVQDVLGLSKSQAKKIVEVYFNETLERIRYNGNKKPQ